MKLKIITKKKISYTNVKNEFSEQLMLIGYVVFSTLVMAVMTLMTKG